MNYTNNDTCKTYSLVIIDIIVTINMIDAFQTTTIIDNIIIIEGECKL
jgi:hypothetical protein